MFQVTGLLKEKEVLVQDPKEGNLIYNKGYYGNPLPDGSLSLSLVECAYLLEIGKLRLYKADSEIGLSDLLGYADAKMPGFEIKYIVYRDLRQRGYVVKLGDKLDFRVYPRGGIPTKTPSKYWIFAISERALFDLKSLVEYLDHVSGVRKELLLGVVDEESDLTYYKVKKKVLRGMKNQKSENVFANREFTGEGVFLEDRVLIPDIDFATKLYENEFYGRPIGKNLQISLIEAAYLMENGLIRLKDHSAGEYISLERFKEIAKTIQRDFEIRLRVYKDLKEKGLLVKTGFKYGAHFRAYERKPQETHAKYLIHAVPENFQTMWPEISRAVRLAHGVRKEILFGSCGDKIEYIGLERVRP